MLFRSQVTPLLKKHGLDVSDPANNRAISNLNTSRSNILLIVFKLEIGRFVSGVTNVQTMFLQKWCNLCGLELYWRNGVFKRHVPKISCELMMSFVNRKLLSTIFDSLQLHTSNGFRSSLVLKPDPENMSTAVEIRCYRVYKLG